MIAGYSDVKMKAEEIFEIFVLMQNDSREKTLQDRGCIKETGQQEESEGRKEKGGEDVRCEDVTQTFLHTDALTQKRFYTQKPLHTQTSLHRSFSHTRFYTQTPFLHYTTQTFSNKHL